MKKKITLFLLIFSNVFFSQETVKLKWKVGDAKTVTEKESTYIYVNNKLTLDSKVICKYQITVLNEDDKNYSLSYKLLDNSIDDLSIDLKNKEANNMLDSLMIKITDAMLVMSNEINKYELKVLIDKETGEALKIINSHEFKNQIKNISTSFLKTFPIPDTINISNIIDTLIDKQGSSFLQTAINNLNSIFFVYSYPFTDNEKITSDVNIFPIDASDNRVFNGKLETFTSRSGYALNMKTKIVNYDTKYKAYLTEEFDNDKLIDLSSIFLIDTENILFNLKTGWLKDYKSTSIAKIDNIRTRIIKEVKFKEVF